MSGARAVTASGGSCRPTRWRRRTVAAALALLGAVALASAGCHRGGGTTYPGTTYPEAPIVLVSIDTLRSDHLPAYGYQGVQTPAIDAFRRQALLFRRAFSQVPLTLPSHVSMLTGQLPTAHGVRDNIGYHYEAERFPSLAAVLGQAGYRTGAAVSAYVLRADSGLAAGFEHYDGAVQMRYTEVLGNSQRAGGETVRAALSWVETVKEQPFFLFVHLYEPHSPYTPPEPFASRYRDPYDGEIAAADADVGALFDGLRRLGVYDEAIVLVLSDHGEGLNEHGEPEHGILLYRETLQVPLLLKLPGGDRAGSSIDTPAQLVDVFPTVLALTGVAPPKGAALAGKSLLALSPADAEREIYAETYYPRLHFGWSEMTSLLRGRYHYIHSPLPELFDLEADPGERRNVLTRERRAYVELKRDLAALHRELAAPAEEDPETARKLAALGYAGSTAKTAPGEALPDPKSKLDTLPDYNEGLVLAMHQRCGEAVPRFERLLAANPKMVEAWEHLGSCLQQLGRLEDALAAFRRALEVSGGAGHVAVLAAQVYLNLGKLDEARAHAELALTVSPTAAHNLLALVALERGDSAAAEKEARAALAVGEERIGPRLTLSTILAKRGDLEGALREIDGARVELAQQGSGEYPGIHYLRGDLLARSGRSPEAIAEFEAEIAAFPGDPRPYGGLALLHAADGRPGEAAAALRRLIDTQGSPGAYGEAVRALRVLGDRDGAAALLQRGLSVYPQSQELQALRG